MKIRIADLAEKDEIIDMMNASFKDERAYLPITRNDKFWKWKFETSSFGRALITVAEDNGRIVGAQTCWPWTLSYAGHELKAFQLVDTSVHPEYRGHGLFLKMTVNSVKIANDFSADLIFGFPNKNALHGYLKLYYNKVFPVKWWIKALKPIRLLDKTSRNSSGSCVELSPDLEINENSIQKIRFDNVYERRIQIRTSFDYLRWRYVEHPFNKYGLVFDRGKGTSSAIFLIRETVNEYREMIVLETFGPVKQYGDLLKELINTAKTLKVSMIAIMDSKDFQASEVFKKKRFLRAKNKLFFTIPTRLDLEPITSDISNWRMVAGLHDSV